MFLARIKPWPWSKPVDTPADQLVTSEQLLARKARLQRELTARLYLYEQLLIATSVAYISEYGSVTRLSTDCANGDIGQAILNHLARYQPDLPADLRGQKSTEWEAFRASGSKTVKAFRADAWCVTIDTHLHGLRFAAQPYASTGLLYAGTEISINSPPEALGEAVRRVLEAAAALRRAKLV